MLSRATKHLLSYAGLLCVLLLSQVSFAEQKKTFSSYGIDYDVHYSVVNTSFLSPEVAKAYDIVRGKNRAILNISVRKVRPPMEQTDALDDPQRAIVSGKTSDLMRSQALEFKEIIETGAIYHIAEFSYHNEELRRFEVDIQPNPNIAPYTLVFSQKVYYEKY